MNYGKSINGRECIGECVAENKLYINPLTLRPMYSNNNECPTYPFEDKKTNRIIYWDICDNPVTSKNVEVEKDISLPKFSYPHKYFINTYYNINSFDDLAVWLDKNKNNPIFTKIRLLKYSIVSYLGTISEIDDSIVDVFIEYIKKILITDIYRKVYIYIDIKEDKISIAKKNNNRGTKGQKIIEKFNFLISRFANNSFIYNFLDDYTKSKNVTVDNIETEYIKYIIKNII